MRFTTLDRISLSPYWRMLLLLTGVHMKHGLRIAGHNTLLEEELFLTPRLLNLLQIILESLKYLIVLREGILAAPLLHEILVEVGLGPSLNLRRVHACLHVTSHLANCCPRR